jgi:hypothetical protein
MTASTRFTDAAGRLDRIIADIKTRQHQAAGAGRLPSAPVRPGPGLHPDQAWWRNYAARTIHSRGESAPSAADHAVPKLSGGLRLSDIPSMAPSGPAPASGHIGAALGKPPGQRGVLARFFRGADR